MFVQKFENHTLHITGITQKRQKYLIFIMVPQTRKN